MKSCMGSLGADHQFGAGFTHFLGRFGNLGAEAYTWGSTDTPRQTQKNQNIEKRNRDYCFLVTFLLYKTKMYSQVERKFCHSSQMHAPIKAGFDLLQTPFQEACHNLQTGLTFYIPWLSKFKSHYQGARFSFRDIQKTWHLATKEMRYYVLQYYYSPHNLKKCKI